MTHFKPNPGLAARVALEHTASITGKPKADLAAALLTSLMHLCQKDSETYDTFQLALDVARYRFAQERNPDAKVLSTKMD